MPETSVSEKLDRIKHLLGKQPDHELAKQAGTPVALVARFRRKHGIPASAGRNEAGGESGDAPKRRGRKPGRPAKAAKAAKAPKAAAAAKPRGKPGRRKGSKAPRRSKLDAFRDLIGKIPDKEVANRAGVSTEGVRMYRQRHSIALEPGARVRRGRVPKALKAAQQAAAAQAPRRGPGRPRKVVAPAAAAERGGPRRRISKLDPYRDMLGTIPDRELAHKAGVTAENVRAYRRRHDIAATWREDEAPAPKAARTRPATAAPRHLARAARPSSAQQGYAISVVVGTSSHEYMIIAQDISSAAESAVEIIRSRHPNGEITAIRHLGTALS